MNTYPFLYFAPIVNSMTMEPPEDDVNREMTIAQALDNAPEPWELEAVS